MKTETNIINFNIKNSNSELIKSVTIGILRVISYTAKCFIACSVFFLFLSMFVFNLEIQEFNHDFTKIQKRTCVIQQTTLLETIYAYFNEV